MQVRLPAGPFPRRAWNAESAKGTAFVDDFPLGSCWFTVQAYGSPTGLGNTFQVVARSQTNLPVRAVLDWQQASAQAPVALLRRHWPRG